MRLRIVKVNFTAQHEWLFELTDQNGQEYYIMNELFYQKNNLESPVTKKELDYYDARQWIIASTIQVEEKGIVVKL